MRAFNINNWVDYNSQFKWEIKTRFCHSHHFSLSKIQIYPIQGTLLSSKTTKPFASSKFIPSQTYTSWRRGCASLKLECIDWLTTHTSSTFTRSIRFKRSKFAPIITNCWFTWKGMNARSLRWWTAASRTATTSTKKSCSNS